MTPEQRAQYESDRAQAEAVYLRAMMETNAIVTSARMPAKPSRQTWWSRLLRRMTDKTTHGVAVGASGAYEARVKELAPDLGMPLAMARADMEAKDGVSVGGGGQGKDVTDAV